MIPFVYIVKYTVSRPDLRLLLYTCNTFRVKPAFTYGPWPRRMPGTMGKSVADAERGRAGILVAHRVDMIRSGWRVRPDSERSCCSTSKARFCADAAAKLCVAQVSRPASRGPGAAREGSCVLYWRSYVWQIVLLLCTRVVCTRYSMSLVWLARLHASAVLFFWLRERFMRFIDCFCCVSAVRCNF